MKDKKILKKKGSQENYELTLKNSEHDLKNTQDHMSILTRKIATNTHSSIASPGIHTNFESPQNVLRNAPRNELSSYVIGPYTSIDVAMATESPAQHSGSKPVEFRRKNIPGVSGSEDSFMERMKKYDELEIVRI